MIRSFATDHAVYLEPSFLTGKIDSKNQEEICLRTLLLEFKHPNVYTSHKNYSDRSPEKNHETFGEVFDRKILYRP